MFGHPITCRSTALAFFAAIHFVMKRFTPCSAVLHHSPSSWAAVVHWSALIPKALIISGWFVPLSVPSRSCTSLRRERYRFCSCARRSFKPLQMALKRPVLWVGMMPLFLSDCTRGWANFNSEHEPNTIPAWMQTINGANPCAKKAWGGRGVYCTF